MSDYDDNVMNADDHAAEGRLGRKALGLPDYGISRSKGRLAVDRWVRGTALLEPGEEADTWVEKNLARVTASYLARENRSADQVAFYEGLCEAADEAMKNLSAYKKRLYGR
jgi:hypothetical protein